MTSLIQDRPSRASTAAFGKAPRSFLAECRRPIWSSILLGLLGFLVSFLGSWIPSPWLDEAATAHIIKYSVADMLQLWQHIDGVFAPYYLFIHFWVKMTGLTPFALQLPSLLAVGVGTAAMAATGRAVAGWKSQLSYAACFALLPRVTAMGIEARPYAMSAAFTALALLAVVKLHQGKSARYWVLLGFSMIGAVGAHLFAALPIIGLVLVAIVVFPRRLKLSLVATSVVSGIVCLPLAMVGVHQQQQVSWIANAPFNIPNQALVEAWFPSRLDPRSSLLLASVAVSLSILAALTVLIALLAGQRPLPRARLALAAVPPLLAVGVLWADSIVAEPVVLGRYFTSSTPFFAMLLAECIMLLPVYLKQLIALLLAVGCLVLIVSQREPYAKMPANDYSFIASSLRDQAKRGDGLLIEPSPGGTNTARSAMDLYPSDFGDLVDIAQPHPAPLDYPISVDVPIVGFSTGTPLPSHIWLVTEVGQDSKWAAQLTNVGFKPTSASSGPAHTVTLWTRT
ncbi:glycosyltransferase family 39 protein [Arthrobacter sp. SLBN-122]|uniref:glycosyltransferase family 39 protein n=1 Tax=Arthrobacter sp. SLBN-122 TaxID=2768455 RepID=UPI00114EE35F|nr:glycosyltransferase family 39 protein [Arthrobacter sp. SLBN-122]TQJ33061.1 mannosyltransferase [Arthrobacter sp. SLBN-122]